MKQVPGGGQEETDVPAQAGLFVLSGPSTDWARPTHTGESERLDSVGGFRCSSHPEASHAHPDIGTPRGPVTLTLEISHHGRVGVRVCGFVLSGCGDGCEHVRSPAWTVFHYVLIQTLIVCLHLRHRGRAQGPQLHVGPIGPPPAGGGGQHAGSDGALGQPGATRGLPLCPGHPCGRGRGTKESRVPRGLEPHPQSLPKEGQQPWQFPVPTTALDRGADPGSAREGSDLSTRQLTGYICS